MDPVDQDAVRRTLEAQGRLLGHHDQLLLDIWISLHTLNVSIMDLLTPGWAEQVLLAKLSTLTKLPKLLEQPFFSFIVLPE